jgi:hypothetical protein
MIKAQNYAYPRKSKLFESTGKAGLFILAMVGLVMAGAANARGQAPENKKDDAVPASWTVLFRSDNPEFWNSDSKNGKGERIATPVRNAPETTAYVRLRRMDTGEALILPINRDRLLNDEVPDYGTDNSVWWNGSAKDEWKGRHLGIVVGPRKKFPAPNGMISVMNQGWDAFGGSGFGHKVGGNDKQHYCWRGKEIPKTVFEIAVSDGPLSPEEKKSLVTKPRE